MSRQLCWFRNDLRVQDNSALIQALNAGETVGIYIATPQQWQMHDDAPIKIDFWRRNLEVLQNELAKLQVPLLFFQVKDYQEIPALIEKIIEQYSIAGVHYNIEYPLNERRRDAAVEKVCDKHKVKAVAYEDQCLLPPDLVFTKQGQPFKVFTPYARASRELLETAGSVSAYGLEPDSLSQEKPALATLDIACKLNDIDWPEEQGNWAKRWPAGEQHANRQLRHFVEHSIADYQEDRDKPALEGTSSLSPYLCSGIISVRACWEAAVSAGSNASIRTWCNELLWRDFYKYVMHHFPHVCMHQAWNDKYDNVPWRHDEQEFERWTQGETGFPLIDAAMQQLLQTGWMHNRLRMLVAMFLSKNLLIDWRWGERWFMQNLIDGDFAANNGGWQWSASTGTDAAPYFRIFNPVRQSERFDPEGEFIRQYVPILANESAKTIHDPGKLQAEYFEALVDLKFSRERALAAFKKQ
ncbi:MAG: deoxyribodipyrimidine photolyase [Gammaproteobacteria bacterium]|nr:deoxyribodipyrimidine photolyase [Gammaproteobacteria bacterium]MAY01915.1 deoxyribodipyrimidine photolyase [Gammaproteobacteria bacterium]|tara:strand:- start:319 stop:1722 length:1404 start_codon:yes stop_codon:yes gene_type:complete